MAQIREVKNKKGISYKVVVRKKGYKPEYKTFSRKTEAKDWALDVESKMNNGTWGKPIEGEIDTIQTVKDLIDYFEEHEAPRRYAKVEKYKVMYNWWRDKIGNVPLSDVTSSILTQYKNILAKEAPSKPYKEHEYKSNNTVRKYLFALSAILSYAESELELINKNPMKKVGKPEKSKGVVRFLSDDERKLLIKGCKEYSERLYIFVLLAIYSGGRYSELSTLKVENVDFENCMLHFTNTKNDESRGVPVYTKIIEKLKNYLDQNNITGGYIFLNKETGNIHYLKGAFETVVKKIGIKNFRFHDCRHTYASYLAQNGAELLEISILLGHKSLQQTQIYAHLTRKHTAKVVRKMTANTFDDI